MAKRIEGEEDKANGMKRGTLLTKIFLCF